MTDLFVEPEAPAATPPPAVLAPDVVHTPWRHYSAASLRWRDHPELEPFMRAPYQAHPAASGRRRASVAVLPGAALADPPPRGPAGPGARGRRTPAPHSPPPGQREPRRPRPPSTSG